MRSKVRICHLAATGAGATWMVEQLRDLRNVKGYDVSAIISSANGDLGARLEKEGIPYHKFEFEFPSLRGWALLLRRVVELALLLRRERYSVVQSHLFASMVLGRLAAWLADTPVRLTMVAGPYHLEAHTPRWIDKATCWMDTGLIASCEYTRELYRRMGVPERRLHLVYYGPDESKFERQSSSPSDLCREYGLPSEAQLVGMVAYFYPRLPASRWTPEVLHDRANKRQEDLIRATPAILRRFPQARILLIGSGWTEAGEREVERSKQIAASLSLGDAVIFTGYRSDVNNVLVALDVAVQASLSENLGGTIEALLMQCPTVATRTGGLVDSIRHRETGVLVEPLNPDALADGIVELLRDPEAARRMASNGRALMLQEFTLSRTVDKLDTVYRSLLQRRFLGRRRGYRPSVTVFRALIALPVFAYLALRLGWDTKFAPRWDLGWRPVPIPQARHAYRATARRLLLFVRTARRRIRAIPSLLRAAGIGFWTTIAQPPRAATAAIKRTMVKAALRLAVVPRLLRGLLIRGHDRAVAIANRAAEWLRLQPLYAYGYVRYLLRDTHLLKRWDVFFAWVRGRKSGPSGNPPDR